MSASEDDTRGYFVVVNDEEQYSIWLDGSDLPLGWRPEGLRGTKTSAWSTSTGSGRTCVRRVSAGR